jgi:hypothetical protein
MSNVGRGVVCAWADAMANTTITVARRSDFRQHGRIIRFLAWVVGRLLFADDTHPSQDVNGGVVQTQKRVRDFMRDRQLESS